MGRDGVFVHCFYVFMFRYTGVLVILVVGKSVYGVVVGRVAKRRFMLWESACYHGHLFLFSFCNLLHVTCSSPSDTIVDNYNY